MSNNEYRITNVEVLNRPIIGICAFLISVLAYILSMSLGFILVATFEKTLASLRLNSVDLF